LSDEPNLNLGKGLMQPNENVVPTWSTLSCNLLVGGIAGFAWCPATFKAVVTSDNAAALA